MRAYGMSDVGAVRAENQDSFRIEQLGGRTVAVLCDGMGGARAGAEASSLACEAFFANLSLALSKAELPEGDVLLSDAAAFANLRVYDSSRSNKSREGMGTTLVAAMVENGICHVVNVGDSRAYLWRGGVCRQITRDHSYVEELVERGEITREEARSHPRKNLITRALGLSYRMKSDSFTLKLEPEDRILLCSDGLSNVVDEREMAHILLQEDDPRSACEALRLAALHYGAPDNVTVLILSR